VVNAKLFVEGGGDSKALRTECRRGFSELLRKAGLAGRLPRIVPSGSRRDAYGDFCTALDQGEAECFLLVDSEGPVASGADPWTHLRTRPADRWARPAGATDDQCHLMVQCMESWFLADLETLADFFGQGFARAALPATADLEAVARADVVHALGVAARPTRKEGYGKGSHSFKLLALIDPARLVAACPHARRFIETLDRRLGRTPP
jgi:hypothetical protein